MCVCGMKLIDEDLLVISDGLNNFIFNKIVSLKSYEKNQIIVKGLVCHCHSCIYRVIKQSNLAKIMPKLFTLFISVN